MVLMFCYLRVSGIMWFGFFIELNQSDFVKGVIEEENQLKLSNKFKFS